MVRKTILAGILAFALVFAGQIGAQEGAAETGVFAPFVSQLEGEIRNNLIRLSWRDSQDTRGPVYIYRSEIPFSALAALPIPDEVAYGVGSYLDEAEKPGILYYFVAASDEWGQKYTLPIPSSNTTSITVGAENVPASVTVRPGRGGQSQPERIPERITATPGIEGIRARVEDDRVIISFSGADSVKNLLLYRSMNPIRRQEDLLSALIIRQKVISPVIDYPLPGISYYYALVYEEDLNTGLSNIRPGYNATDAVQISSAPAGSRSMPLPAFGSLSPQPGQNDLSSDAAQAVAALRRMEGWNERTVKTAITVFPEDLAKGGSGEEYQLRSIVQGYFSLKEWNKSEDELRRFLDLPRNKINQIKARFYLGQVYYFQGKPREALMEFLQARGNFPEETNPWIQAVLGEFVRN